MTRIDLIKLTLQEILLPERVRQELERELHDHLTANKTNDPETNKQEQHNGLQAPDSDVHPVRQQGPVKRSDV
jgi:hypothetical protein